MSIRAGSIRRQGPVSCGRALRFPHKEKPTEGDQVLKVDIHQKVGTGYLVLKPNQDGSHQYRVVLSSDSGQVSEMSCELEVRPATTSAVDDKPTVQEPEENATATKAKDATEYLKDKGVLQFVQGVLQVVVKEQPEDPFPLMAKHFQDGYDLPAMSRPSTALVEKVANIAKEAAGKPVLAFPTREEAEEEKAAGRPTLSEASIKSKGDRTPGGTSKGERTPGGASAVKFTGEDDEVLEPVGDAGDEDFTKSVGVRSCRGRTATGGWSEEEMQAARSALEEAGEEPKADGAAAVAEAPKADDDAAAGEEAPKPE